MADKTVVCVHNETIVGYIGTCSICGQIREYDLQGRLPPKIIKRGRIDGVLTDVIPVVNQEPVQKEVPAPTPEPTAFANRQKTSLEKGKVEERVVPPKPKERKKLWKYFEQNKEAILSDYHSSMTLLDLFKKWKITSTTWQKLKKAWEVQGKIHIGRTSYLRKKFTLPEFPAFNDKWGDSVQVKWLEVYPELYREAFNLKV